jgi:hypothetical protein
MVRAMGANVQRSGFRGSGHFPWNCDSVKKDARIAIPAWVLAISAIIQLDIALKPLRDGENEVEDGRSWEVRNWSGRMEALRGHADETAVLDMNCYVDECVSVKAKELRPFLHAIRKGLRANLGITGHSALSADLLRDLATGDSGRASFD